jgi:hypothetical protein
MERILCHLSNDFGGNQGDFATCSQPVNNSRRICHSPMAGWSAFGRSWDHWAGGAGGERPLPILFLIDFPGVPQKNSKSVIYGIKNHNKFCFNTLCLVFVKHIWFPEDLARQAPRGMGAWPCANAAVGRTHGRIGVEKADGL